MSFAFLSYTKKVGPTTKGQIKACELSFFIRLFLIENKKKESYHLYQSRIGHLDQEWRAVPEQWAGIEGSRFSVSKPRLFHSKWFSVLRAGLNRNFLSAFSHI